MFNAATYHETIETYVLKADYNWFKSKEIDFKKEDGYDFLTNKIILPNKNFFSNEIYDKEGNFLENEYVDQSEEIEINLREYCSCYLPLIELTNWGSFPLDPYPDISKQSLSKNIYEFASDLIHQISKFTKDFEDIVAVSQFVFKTTESINEALTNLKKVSENEIYHEVLGDFLRVCTAKLYRKFERELTLNELTQNYSDKLNFDLSQEKLASLIFILDKANFFHKEHEKETIFYKNLFTFCQKYFQFKLSNKFKRSTTVKTLRNKFNDASNYPNPNSEHYHYEALQEVMNTLYTTLKEIERG